jgi:CubicO group peptidase (beta-lactamase class C family)
VQDLNQPHVWSQGYPSMGGIGSARALAKFYSVLANGGKWQGVQIIPTWVIGALSTSNSAAVDEVLRVPMSFSAGMMMDAIDAETLTKVSSLFGPSESAFGHAGAGGSLAFADPENGISFAYVMNQMEVGVLPGPKALGLVQAMYA